MFDAQGNLCFASSAHTHFSPFIHCLQQRARFRAVESLQSESRAIVVATDVAARGLDIQNVATVVHYDVARKVDGFVHRAGRTAVSVRLLMSGFKLSAMKIKGFSD